MTIPEPHIEKNYTNSNNFSLRLYRYEYGPYGATQALISGHSNVWDNSFSKLRKH